MTTLTRDQLVARLVGGHYLEVRPDGTALVMLRDERVPRVFLAGAGLVGDQRQGPRTDVRNDFFQQIINHFASRPVSKSVRGWRWSR
ncbi:MAG TPA: hypothetical protein VH482_14755 [Thermomicrobiales bacterium]